MAASARSPKAPSQGKRGRSLADDLRDLFSPAPSAPLWDPDEASGFGHELRHLYDDAADPCDDVRWGETARRSSGGDGLYGADLQGAGPGRGAASKSGRKGAGGGAAKGPLRLKGPLEVEGVEYSGKPSTRAQLFEEPGRGFGDANGDEAGEEEEEEEEEKEEGEGVENGLLHSDGVGSGSDEEGRGASDLRSMLSGAGTDEAGAAGAPLDFERQFEAVVRSDRQELEGGGPDEEEEGGEEGASGEGRDSEGAPPRAFAITGGAPREDEAEKAKAVAAQAALWDRVLEIRILIQRLAGPGARLPAPGDRALFLAHGEAAGAYANASGGLLLALETMVAIAEAVRKQNPARKDAAGPNGVASAGAHRDDHSAYSHVNGTLQSAGDAAEAGRSAQARGGGDAATGSAPSQNGGESTPAVAEAVSGAGGRGGALRGKVDLDSLWGRLTQDYQELKAFSDLSLDRWHRKTLLSAGKLSLSSRGMRLQALDQAVSAQVGSAMRNPERLIKRARAPRDSVHRIRITKRLGLGALAGGAEAPLGAASKGGVQERRGEGQGEGDGERCAGHGDEEGEGAEDGDEEGEGAEDGEGMDAETYDDSDFYQHLLQEFLEASASDELRGLHAFKGRKSKRKKASAVDRRASKGRKIRYTVMTPLVNFMAPEPMHVSPMTESLLLQLFGQG